MQGDDTRFYYHHFMGTNSHTAVREPLFVSLFFFFNDLELENLSVDLQKLPYL